MIPTPDQIAIAAYHRWERRGYAHGQHDGDWRAAEQDLIFARNYEVIAHHRLDEPGPRYVGRRQPRVCRFCEGAAPRARFTDPVPPIPEALGNTALLALDECDECHEAFADGIVADFVRFRRGIARGESGPMPVGAYKGLIKMALSLLPAAELDYVPDAIEWVNNPDHDIDGATFADLGVHVHRAGPGGPFAALARRIDDDAPHPYLLCFLGTGGAVLQAAVPLCVRDEDHEATAVPRVASPLGPEHGPDGLGDVFLPVAATEAPARRR